MINLLEEIRTVLDDRREKRASLIAAAPARVSRARRKALEMDIDRAKLVQANLLPPRHLQLKSWEVCYEYIPLGPVGGDYCDLVPEETGNLFLFLGDAMGKGISGSMFATSMHAMFRTLLDTKVSLLEMTERANRIFCDLYKTAGYYATLVCGCARPNGELTMVNAGHVPCPVVLTSVGVNRVSPSGAPLGLQFTSQYEVFRVELLPGETLLCATDGVTEARDASDREYGEKRLEDLASRKSQAAPEELVHACSDDASAFASNARFSDDVTLLALRRTGHNEPRDLR